MNFDTLNDNWGLSCSIDVYDVGDIENIKDVNFIRQFLSDLVIYLDMKPFGEPIIERFGAEDHLYGISAVQLIYTSCITLHAAENEGNVYIDVFSCKEYSPYNVEEFICAYFDGKSSKMNYTWRR